MTLSIKDLIDQVKQVNRIEDVIADPKFGGYTIIGHGRNVMTSEQHGLKIDIHNQRYWWFSNGDEHGDVINWVMKRMGCDFASAMEFLCTRAGLPAPNWKNEDPAVRYAAREREDVLEVACDVFHKLLLADPTAMDYCRRVRGWTDETIVRNRIGYTGARENTEKLRKEIQGAMGKLGIDSRSPAAVSVLGLSKDVPQWIRDHNLQENPDHQKTLDGWIEKGYIHGVVGWNRIVYPFLEGARTVYFNLRGIVEDNLPAKYNPPSVLVGEKRIFLNSKWSPEEDICVVVEGPADAITLDQWDIPGSALNGVAANDQLLRKIGAAKQGRENVFFLGLDADKAGSLTFDLDKTSRFDLAQDAPGTLNALKVAKLLGPMTRIVRWRGVAGITSMKDADGNDRDIKDANDLLRAANQKEISPEVLLKEVNVNLNTSPTFVEEISKWAGKQEGAGRDEAIRQALNTIAVMKEVERAQYQKTLAKYLQLDQRELTRMVKTILDQAKKKDNEGDVVQFTLGGLIGGYLLEYLYDRPKHQSKLAWRDLSGKVHGGDSVTIDGIKYRPYPPEETFRERGIFFPSEVGDLKTAGELAGYIENYINSVYILSNELMGKIISYWVLVTWLYDCFNALPYLRAMGASGAGKSELLYRVGLVSYRMLMAGGADTVSTLFRSVDLFHPTVLFDEGDIEKSDASNEIVKFLNFGSMKGHPIWRSEEVIDENGKKTYKSRMYPTYCPKMIGMRKDFKDDAVGNRAITFKIQERGMRELIARNIDLEVTEETHQRALNIRNMMVHWRLHHWQPEIRIDKSYYELDISARLNQITGALMMVAQDDESLRSEIKGFMREYYLEMAQTRNQTIIARIIEAILKIYQYPDLNKRMVKKDSDGKEKILVGDATKIANEIIDSMYSVDEDKPTTDEDQKPDRNHLYPHKIGRIIREDMQMKSAKRSHDGIAFYYDQDRIFELARQYGIDPVDFGPLPGKPKDMQLEIPQ